MSRHMCGVLPRFVQSAIALSLLAVCASSAWGETLRLQRGSVNEWYPDGYGGIEDVALYDRQPDANFGAFHEWESGATETGGAQRVLIRWDLEVLAPLFSSERYQVVLTELKLGLWYNRDAQAQPFDVYRVASANAAWREGTGLGKSQGGSATWNEARAGEQAWAGEAGCGKPGVDYDAEPVARFVSDTATHMRPRYLNPVRLPVDLVRDWALHPERNTGLLIKHADEQSAPGSVNFIPSEHTRSDYGWDRHHPELIITYIDKNARGVSEPGELVSGGRTGHVVVVPADATPSERRAANELVDHVRQMTGAVAPVVPEDVYDEDLGPAVNVGRTEASKAVLTDAELTDLGDDGYVIRRKGEDLFLVGGRRRGALYAVFAFLEDLGVRWYTPKFNLIPECTDIALPDADTRYVPGCFYRDQLWNNGNDEAWRARMRLNGEYSYLPESWGGSTKVQNGCHSYHVLVPGGAFETHPDWFAVKEDGKRHPGSVRYVSLCTTNPELREHIVATVRAQLAGEPGIEHCWVSQDDGGESGCFCEACTAERNLYGGEDRWAANTISLANHVARAIKDDFPKVRIKTLAYSYTVDAPENLPVEDNVLVVLCGPPCVFHTMDQCEKNVPFYENLKRWARICNGIQTYFYGGPNYGYLWPYPSWFAMCTDYPIAYENGVRAVYRQGTMIGYGAEFTELRAYLTARMAWDPHTDYMRVYREFTDAYYGPAAPHIREYMEWYAARCRDNGIDSGGFWGEADAWKRWVDEDVIQTGERCFKAALEAVPDAEAYRERVRAAYLPILFARVLSTIPEEPVYLDGDYMLLSGADDSPICEAANLFTEIMAEAGYNRWNEPTAYDPDNNPILALTRKHPYRMLDNGTDQAYVLPTLGGRVVRWDAGLLGGNVFRRPQSKSDSYPCTGGYEEYMRFDRGSPGIAVSYEVAHADARRIELRATVEPEVEVVRAVELAPDRPVLSIRTTYTNRGDKPVEVGPRTHPEFAFRLFEGASLYYKDADGTWATRSMYSPDAPTGDTLVPEGEFSGGLCVLGDVNRNVGIVNRFDADTIRTVYGYWSEQLEAVNLEIWGRTRILQPGESYSFDHSYEYLDDVKGFLAAKP